MRDLNDELDDNDDLLDQLQERIDCFNKAIDDEIVAVKTGKITPAEMRKLHRERKQEIQEIQARQQEIQARQDDLERRLRRRVS
jgi:hypothetical protein